MELGEITLSDIFLTIAGAIISAGGGIWFFKRLFLSKNSLTNNRSGGDIAGGNLSKGKNLDFTYSRNKNVLENNSAEGDIAGGDINK